jgi:hypothetical protein
LVNLRNLGQFERTDVHQDANRAFA